MDGVLPLSLKFSEAGLTLGNQCLRIQCHKGRQLWLNLGFECAGEVGTGIRNYPITDFFSQQIPRGQLHDFSRFFGAAGIFPQNRRKAFW